MNFLEQISVSIRHHPFLEHAEWLWNRLRPAYNYLIDRLAHKGLQRTINGTDCILILPELRQVPEIYEPDVWQSLMSHLYPGSIFVDVGAYIGVYSIAAAKRVGKTGKVFAFEPDPNNFLNLNKQICLNDVVDQIEIIPNIVGESNEIVEFYSGSNLQSSVLRREVQNTEADLIQCVSLDQFFPTQSIHTLKIDVEGYEEPVLRGARELLTDPKRRPEFIYLEVHLYAWSQIGTSWDSLLDLMYQYHYDVACLDGSPPKTITFWGEVLGTKKPS
jgi:FkbM family methyltransferase